MYRSEYNTLFYKRSNVNTYHPRRDVVKNDENTDSEVQHPSSSNKRECKCNRPVKSDENRDLRNDFVLNFDENVDIRNQSSNHDGRRLRCSYGYICIPEHSYKNGSIKFTQPRCFKCKKICPRTRNEGVNTFSYYSHTVNRKNDIDRIDNRAYNECSELCKDCGKVDCDCINKYDKYVPGSKYGEPEPTNNVNRKKKLHCAFRKCFGGSDNDLHTQIVRNNLESVKYCMKNRSLQKKCYKICNCENQPDTQYCLCYNNVNSFKDGKVRCVPITPEERPLLSNKDKNKICFNEIIGTPCNSNSVLMKPPVICEPKACKSHGIIKKSKTSNVCCCHQLKNKFNNKCNCHNKKKEKFNCHCKKENHRIGPKSADDDLNGENKSCKGRVCSPCLTKKDFWQYSDCNLHNQIPYGLKFNDKDCKCHYSCNNENFELWKRIDDIEKNGDQATSNNKSNNNNNRNLSRKLSDLLFKKYDEFCDTIVKCISKQFTFPPINLFGPNTCKCCSCKETYNNCQSKLDTGIGNEKINNSRNCKSFFEISEEHTYKNSPEKECIEDEQLEKSKTDTGIDNTINEKRMNSYRIKISCGKCVVKTTKHNSFYEIEDLLPPRRNGEKMISNLLYSDFQINCRNKSNANLKTKSNLSVCECKPEDLKDCNNDDNKIVDSRSEFIYPQLPEISDLENKNETEMKCCKDNCLCDISSPDTSSTCLTSSSSSENCKDDYVKPERKSPFWKKYFDCSYSDQDLLGGSMQENKNSVEGTKGLLKWKGVVFSPEEGNKNASPDDSISQITESDASGNQILVVELNRGWNSRLGFSLQSVGQSTVISAIYPDSVASRDGRLLPGDQLIMVNDESVEGMNTAEVIDLLRKIRGSICITVWRNKTKSAVATTATSTASINTLSSSSSSSTSTKTQVHQLSLNNQDNHES